MLTINQSIPDRIFKESRNLLNFLYYSLNNISCFVAHKHLRTVPTISISPFRYIHSISKLMSLHALSPFSGAFKNDVNGGRGATELVTNDDIGRRGYRLLVMSPHQKC